MTQISLNRILKKDFAKKCNELTKCVIHSHIPTLDVKKVKPFLKISFH